MPESTLVGADRARLRAVAEAMLCEATGAVRVGRLCPHCGSSRHGQPRLVGSDLVGSDLVASISYADGLVAVAWGPAPVGVDIERVEAEDDPDLRAWTRLEALAKADGLGLRDWPRRPPPEHRLTRDLRLPPGYVGTVAGEALVRLGRTGGSTLQ